MVSRTISTEQDTEDDKTSVQGESLLLPLLQELLDKKINSTPLNRSGSSHSSEGSTTAAADSGTESGEDLRLIAAGLCDSADVKRQNTEPLSPSLLNEVQNALTKLETSLQIDDIGMDNQKRSSLLELIKRLQVNLLCTKSDQKPRRFQKRSRQQRHTVGVSSEELAAARKLIDDVEIDLKDNINNQDINNKEDSKFILQKQHSDGNVTPSPFIVPNTVPKPFSNPSKPPIDIHSYKLVKNIQEPNEPTETEHKKDFRKSLSFDNYKPVNEQKTLSSFISVDAPYDNDEYENFKRSLAVKHINENLKYFQEKDKTEQENDKTIQETLLESDKTTVTVTPQTDTSSIKDVTLNDSVTKDDNIKTNRYNNRKLKLKRANTIDIPKPINFVLQDEDYDDSVLDNPEYSPKRNYLALRGPIRVGNNPKTNVPTFEPKTENDKKFMAFIQKHNNNPNININWKKTEEKPINKFPALPFTEHNWSRKFGNIKTIFESEQRRASSPMMQLNSAKKFWQQAESQINEPKDKKKTSETEQKPKTKLPWNEKVVSASLKVETNPQQNIQNNQLVQGKQYKFIPQPLPVNKFSHAPMSAFKPPQKKQKSEEPESPLYLYTPKHLNFPESIPKPAPSQPWLANQSEHRVLNLAASKFENPVKDIPKQKAIPQKTHHTSFKTINKPENDKQKLFASDTFYKTSNNKVRRLSGEYDNKTLKPKVEEKLEELKPHERRRKLSDDYTNMMNNKNLSKQNVEKPKIKSEKPSLNKINNANEKQKIEQKPANENEFYSYNNHKPETHVKFTDKSPNKIVYTPENYEPEIKNVHDKVKIYNKKDEETFVPLTALNNTHYDQKNYDENDYTEENSNRYTPEVAHINNVYDPHYTNGQNYQYYVEPKFQYNEIYEKPYQQTYYPEPNQNMENHYQPQSYQEPYNQMYDQYYNQPVYQQQVYQPQPVYEPTSYQPSDSVYDQTKTNYQPQTYQSEAVYEQPKPGYQSNYNYEKPETDYKPLSPVMSKSSKPDTFEQSKPIYQQNYDQVYDKPNSHSPVISKSSNPKQYYAEPKTYVPKEPQIYIASEPQVIHKTYQPIPEKEIPNSNQLQPINKPQQLQSPNQLQISNQLQPIHKPQQSPSPNHLQPSPNPQAGTHGTLRSPSGYEINIPDYSVLKLHAKYNKLTPEPQEDVVPIDKQQKSEKPKQLLKIFDYSSPEQSPIPTEKIQEPATPPLTEYKAVSKVMVGPVCQQAVTVSQNTPKRREEHDTAANHLQNILQRRSSPKDSESSGRLTASPVSPDRRSVSPRVPKHDEQIVHKPPEIHINNKTITSESYEIENNGETILSTKLQIPVNNIQFKQDKPRQLSPTYGLSKSDSWHQLIPEQHLQSKPSPSPRASPQARAVLQKAKSSHSLAIPKQFEAGMDRDEIEIKKKTVQAYFGPQLSKTSSTQNIHEKKKSRFSGKSKQNKQNALSRSQTMPDVVYNEADDIDDVDAEFENIFKASVCK